jgi:lysophospholipase L1-like esterase
MSKFSRRQFLKRSTALALAGAATRSGLMRAAAVTQNLRPLEMLVLGDSVMWGQGLKEEMKFYTLTQNWLSSSLGGRRVNKPFVKAHSGAKLLPKTPCPQADGEVNIVTPTVLSQLEAAARAYDVRPNGRSQVDLVLVNGGINDLGVPNILNILNPDFHLRGETTRNCARMKCVLESIAATFPNARIVVTGYYPIVSKMTRKETLPGLMAATFTGSEYAEINEILKTILNNTNPLSWFNNQFLDRWVDLSTIWYEASTRALQDAVNTVNNESTITCRPEQLAIPDSRSSFTLTSLPGGRVFFAGVDFQPEHCYGARDTLLWQVERDPNNVQSLMNLVTNDHLFSLRRNQCDGSGEKGKCTFNGQLGPELITCRLAGAGHPNEKGARYYAEAIKDQLNPILDRTGWRS